MKLQKETYGHGKWYGDACGTAFALELIGERWSLLVVRELMLGGRRFSDIRASLPGISAKVLTERLGSLEEAGVLTKRLIDLPVPAQIYELTEWGHLAEPAIQELGRWAAMSPLHDPTLPLSPVSLMLSLRTMIDKDKAGAFDAVIGFAIGNETFQAQLRGGALPIKRGVADVADAVFRAPAAPLLAAHIYGKVPIAQLEGQQVRLEGDAVLAARFVDLFHLPAKVAALPGQ